MSICFNDDLVGAFPKPTVRNKVLDVGLIGQDRAVNYFCRCS